MENIRTTNIGGGGAERENPFGVNGSGCHCMKEGRDFYQSTGRPSAFSLPDSSSTSPFPLLYTLVGLPNPSPPASALPFPSAPEGLYMTEALKKTTETFTSVA